MLESVWAPEQYQIKVNETDLRHRWEEPGQMKPARCIQYEQFFSNADGIMTPFDCCQCGRHRVAEQHFNGNFATHTVAIEAPYFQPSLAIITLKSGARIAAVPVVVFSLGGEREDTMDERAGDRCQRHGQAGRGAAPDFNKRDRARLVSRRDARLQLEARLGVASAFFLGRRRHCHRCHRRSEIKNYAIKRRSLFYVSKVGVGARGRILFYISEAAAARLGSPRTWTAHALGCSGATCIYVLEATRWVPNDDGVS